MRHQLPKRSLATARKSEAYSVEPLMRGCGAPGLQISFGNGGSLAGPSTVPVGVLTIYLASAMWRKSYRSWGTCPIMITAVPAAKWHSIVNTGPALAKLVSPQREKLGRDATCDGVVVVAGVRRHASTATSLVSVQCLDGVLRREGEMYKSKAIRLQYHDWGRGELCRRCEHAGGNCAIERDP